MRQFGRKYVPYLMLGLFLAALTWALWPEPLPPADFTFSNGTEIKTVDPAIVTGQPEGRIIRALYEGLLDWDPKDLHPIPGVAESWEVSEDRRTYTFQLREDARWSNGDPVSAHDFVWSFRRFLDPMTAAEYAFLLHHVQGAQQYNMAQVEVGQPVEVELKHRAPGARPHARFEVLRGKLVEIQYPSEKAAGEEATEVSSSKPASGDDDGAQQQDTQQQDSEQGNADDQPSDEPSGDAEKGEESEAAAEETDGQPEGEAVYAVEIDGELRRFARNPELLNESDVEAMNQVLPDFRDVGIRALDDRTLQIELKYPVPYFLNLMGFYPLFPVHQATLETYGYPEWTRPENIVTNGPFLLESRRVRDRIRMVKNPLYWDREHVYLNIIDALAIESQTTALNMYLTGDVDWIPDVPVTIIPELLEQDRPDFQPEAYLGIYYYRVNTTRPPLSDPRVRRALALALDRQEVVGKVTRAGEIPADRFVPPGIAGYERVKQLQPLPEHLRYNVDRARQLLAEAGYPGGKGCPKIELLYNTHEAHAQVAELLQSQWKETLGVNIELVNKEWGSYLSDQQSLNYDLARAGWIGDYADPNTFLDLFVTDGPQNQTGWGNPRYDELIEQAGEVQLTADERAAVEAQLEQLPADEEVSPDSRLREALDRALSEKRMRLFLEAEEILLDELPVIPLYYYVSKAMVRPYVKGLYQNIQDTHPYKGIWIDRAEKIRILKSEGLQ